MSHVTLAASFPKVVVNPTTGVVEVYSGQRDAVARDGLAAEEAARIAADAVLAEAIEAEAAARTALDASLAPVAKSGVAADVAFTPAAGISASDVQAAIAEAAAMAGNGGGGAGGGDMLATVADLLASTEPARGEGEIWQAGGFHYREAAAEASDAHLETAGGVKLYVLPGASGWYNFAAMGPAADGGIVGGVATGTNDWPKLEKLLAIRLPGAGTNPKGPSIFFPAGSYYMGVDANGIQLKAVTRLLGEAMGQMNTPVGSRLFFPNNCVGITVNRHDTLNGGHQPGTGGASGSEIRGLALVSSVGSDKSAHGIWLRARAVISDCHIRNWSGNGIEINASWNGGPETIGNANCFHLERLRIQGCEHGVHAKGADANAGHGISIDAASNRRWGIFDASFLGNSWSACHTEANGSHVAGGVSAYARFDGTTYHANPLATETEYVETQPGTNPGVWRQCASAGGSIIWTGDQEVGTYRTGGGYHSDNLNARATFYGCYSEIGQGLTWLSPHSIAIGGFLKEVPVVRGAAIEGRFNATWSRQPFRTEAPRVSDGRRITASVGGDANILTAFEFEDSAHSATYRWQAMEDGGWRLTRNNIGIGFALRGNSETYRPNTMQFNHGFVLGQSSNTRVLTRVNYSTADGVVLPTEGEWVRGDIGLAPNPNPGDFIGWICMTSGTAGDDAVFAKFGLIGSSGKREVHDRGTLSTGTHTPQPSDGEFQVASNNGAHTIAASTSQHGGYRLVYANAAAAGAITLTGFDTVFDPDGALAHTVEGSAVEILVSLDPVAKVAQVTLLVDAT